MKKRIVAIAMAALLSVSMIGCGLAGEAGKETGSFVGQDVGGSREDGGSGQSAGGGTKTGSENGGDVIGDFLQGLFGQKNAGNSTGDTVMSVYPDSLDGYGMVTEACDEAYGMRFYNGGMVELPEIDWNTEEYSYRAENPWLSVKTSPFSTFAADVDTASYANVRRMLTRGQEVPVDAVRIEEMINYFRYDYPEPKAGEPFSVTTEMAPCPWNENSRLFMVGLKAMDLDTSERPDSNLVFLIDVSGSMDEADKLPLVQRSFQLLCEELRPGDRVSIVTYATGDKIVLDGATGEDKTKIREAIEDLFASGGTNGSAGIQTAYQLAEKYFIKGGNNRVILATDGDLNIGVTDEGSLTRLIEEKAKSGVFLSVLGFGWGNISDTRMEALADHGNGNYSYIDNISEARKVLIDEMGSTLFTVAKDVKLQVEFNPALVKGYRLIGYENRVMAAEDFANDAKDGGEIGAGHQVTALYEIALKDSRQEIPEVESRYGKDGDETGTTGGSDGVTGTAAFADEYLTVNVRYKEPEGDTSKLLVYPVKGDCYHQQMSENLSWAAGVAQAGMILKKSEYAGSTDLKEVMRRLESLGSVKEDDYRKEFVYLFSKYQP